MKKISVQGGTAVNTVILTGIRILTAVMGLIVTKLLSVHLSLEEYGTYSQAMLVTSTATSLSVLGLVDAVSYFYNRTADERKQRAYLATIFSAEYLMGILTMGVILLGQTQIVQYFSNEALRKCLWVAAFLPTLENLMLMCYTLFLSIGLAKKLMIRNLVVCLIRLLFAVYISLVQQSVMLFLILTLVLDMGQFIYYMLTIRNNRFPISVGQSSFSLLPEILRFSVPMAVYVATNSLSRDMDKYVIGWLADTETLAVYSNASKVLPFDVLTRTMITVLVPILTRYIHRERFDEAKDVFKLYLRIGYLMTFIIVGGAVAVSDDLMLFLYDEKYISGLSVFVVYLFVDMISFANVTTILTGAGKTKVLMISSLVMLAFNGVFNVLTYRMWGMIGPAITTLVLSVLMCIFLLRYGAGVLHSRLVDLFQVGEMGLLAVEILVVGFGTNRLSTALVSKAVPQFWVLAISYGVYAVVMLGFNYKRILSCLRELNQYK